MLVTLFPSGREMMPNPESAKPRAEDQRKSKSTTNGVDTSLVDWMLSLSPAERLAVAEDWANMVDAFDDGERADGD